MASYDNRSSSENGFRRARSRSQGDGSSDKRSKEELAKAEKRRLYIGNLGYNVSVDFDSFG